MPVDMAVDDIITRGVGELRKSAFGEVEEAGSMAWSKEQVFFILKALAKSEEVSISATSQSVSNRASVTIL